MWCAACGRKNKGIDLTNPVCKKCTKPAYYGWLTHGQRRLWCANCKDPSAVHHKAKEGPKNAEEARISLANTGGNKF